VNVFLCAARGRRPTAPAGRPPGVSPRLGHDGRPGPGLGPDRFRYAFRYAPATLPRGAYAVDPEPGGVTGSGPYETHLHPDPVRMQEAAV
jgi:hypothetical protein